VSQKGTVLHYNCQVTTSVDQSKVEVHTRDNSFPRNVEFWAEPRNLPISAEFLRFHGILQNLVLDGDKGTNTAYFGGVQAAVEDLWRRATSRGHRGATLRPSLASR